jgi:hypothetical protein
MPFDPKIIRENDADLDATADLQLPADLALMAEQLGDDAARLAACYPPPVPAAIQPAAHLATPNSRRMGYWLSRSLAGTALAMALVAISLVAPKAYRPRPGNNFLPAAVHEVPSPPNSVRVPVTTASWLGDTTGPELEALMDLWAQENREKASLSF